MAASMRGPVFRKFLRKYLRKRCARPLSSEATSFKQNTSNADQTKHTHFGFETVPEYEKEEKVYGVFKNVATKYDLMNDAMSMGVHRLWKDTFIQKLSPRPGTKLLDVAGGTGDIAFRFLKYVETIRDEEVKTDDDNDFQVPSNIEAGAFSIPQDYSQDGDDSSEERRLSDIFNYIQDTTHVTVCDINQEMLNVGKEKATQLSYDQGISWLKGNAECLPVEDNSFDAYTIAFGIRNCTHIDKVIEEAYRVLKPGGRFMCLEFSQVENPALRSLYDSYSFEVIPVIGQVLARDWKSYQYLVESIRQFPDQKKFASMIKQAGFSMVQYENLTFGVVAIHSGFKL